jgi:DNA-binding transcriptional ArsR family regulator
MYKAEFMNDNHCAETYIHEQQVQAALTNLVDNLTAVRLAELFKALSDPTRVRIVSLLTDAELCVCDLAAALDMSQPAISHQLRTLRGLRLVRWRREGRQIFYTLDDEHVVDLFHLGMDHVAHGSLAGNGQTTRDKGPFERQNQD